MGEQPQLPDEISPRGRWFGIASRRSARRLNDAETPAKDATPDESGGESYDARVLPTYRTYSRAEQLDATGRYSASWAGYFGDEPPAKIADEDMQLPINEDGYVYDGTENAIGATVQYAPNAVGSPGQPYAATPPSSIAITRGVAAVAATQQGPAPTSDGDMAAWLMRGDF